MRNNTNEYEADTTDTAITMPGNTGQAEVLQKTWRDTWAAKNLLSPFPVTGAITANTRRDGFDIAAGGLFMLISSAALMMYVMPYILDPSQKKMKDEHKSHGQDIKALAFMTVGMEAGMGISMATYNTLKLGVSSLYSGGVSLFRSCHEQWNQSSERNEGLPETAPLLRQGGSDTV